MRGSGTGCGGGGIRPARSVTNGNISGSKIDDGGRNEKRRNLVGAAVQQLAVLPLDDVESADARGNINTDIVQIRMLRLPI